MFVFILSVDVFRTYYVRKVCLYRFKNNLNIIFLMDPKKDVSTAILDQKKAPNKLLVQFL